MTEKVTFNLESLQAVFAKAKAESEGKKEEPCKGLIFRLNRGAWSHERDSVGFKYQFKFLKRKSCKGCDKCLWLWDDLHERICDWGNDGYGSDIEFGDDNQALYQLKVTDWSTDWESGLCDDWNVGFVKYTEVIEDD